MWAGDRLKKSNDITSRSHIAWRLDENWEAAQRRATQEEWAIEKPKLEDARNARGVYSIDPSDEIHKNMNQKCKAKVVDTNGSCDAMQKSALMLYSANRCIKNRKNQKI